MVNKLLLWPARILSACSCHDLDEVLFLAAAVCEMLRRVDLETDSLQEHDLGDCSGLKRHRAACRMLK
jgi:hypothetical protein